MDRAIFKDHPLASHLKKVTLLKTQGYIDGKWVDADSKQTFPLLNPADETEVAQIADMGVAETERAIQSATKAFKSWHNVPCLERAKVLRRWFELIQENREDLAQILMIENGKPITQARAEIDYAASFAEWFSEEAKRSYGETAPSPDGRRRVNVIKQPIGVVAALTPWNFPAGMITRKVGPALAAGCTVVLKPAEDTPLTALALTDLAVQAGVPAGALNIITTSNPKEVGEMLTTHKDVRKVSFTGSTEVGRILMRQSAETVKKVSLELGGNAPFIVFEDADIELTLDEAMALKFRNGGQACTSMNRLFVHSSLYDQVVAELTKRIEGLTIGDGAHETTDLGPMINAKAAEKISNLVDGAVKDGAKVMTGGKRSDLGSCYYEATVLRDVTPQMEIFRQEIFGPVICAYRFETDEEVIALANDTHYGLASYFFTQDVTRAWKIAEQLEYGLVGVNEVALSSELIPFGGFKQSGIGREGAMYGLEEFLETKSVCFGVR